MPLADTLAVFLWAATALDVAKQTRK